MIIELKSDVQVRVPVDRLPTGSVEARYYTFRAGDKVNYSSEKSGGTHMTHRFTGNNLKWGFLQHSTVTLINDRPHWL